MESPEQFACTECGSMEGLIRCRDCWLTPIWCKGCCLSAHDRLPFHRVEAWTGKYFRPSTLMVLGYVLHVGHNGKPCNNNSNFHTQANPANDPSKDDSSFHSAMVVVSSTGVFQHRVHWCSCGTDRHLQLLRAGMFPASIHRPATAFTFDVLDHFYLDAMECKTSAQRFFTKLRRFTDESFWTKVDVSKI
jgi:hypothetical protein